MEDSSAASKLVELQGKIELTMHRLDTTLREKQILFESKLQDKLFDFETVRNDDSCLQRVDELDCDLNRLSDLSAQKHAEMDANSKTFDSSVRALQQDTLNRNRRVLHQLSETIELRRT